MAKIIQRRISVAVTHKTRRTVQGHKRSSIPYTIFPQYRKIENRTRALECCIFDAHAKKSAAK